MVKPRNIFNGGPTELAEVVSGIIAVGGDPDAAHGLEDRLHRMLLDTYCPEWVRMEIDRLTAADFPRWTA